jgi:phytoene dehydrogenase-like protein
MGGMNGAADKPNITIIGGGVAGLYSAIVAAEAGAQVILHEAARTLGGRARSADGEWKANYGPHALYGDGPMVPWLRSKKLLPALRRPAAAGFRLRVGGTLKWTPLALVRAILRLTSTAPDDASFGDWASQRTSNHVANAAAAFASLPTFHAYPEQLSAAFVAERLRRVTRRAAAVRYVAGGWSELVDRLDARASKLGVSIHLGSYVSELPDPPVIVATSARSAQRLLGRDLPQTGTSVALLDVGFNDTGQKTPFAVLDLDERTYVARYSALDPELSPPGTQLIQACAPLRSGETHYAATTRLERSIETIWPEWSKECRWRRAAFAIDSTGAVDPPGRTWHDRPAITQARGVFLAGDYVAAPGLLSEVSWASAIKAARLAADWHPARDDPVPGTPTSGRSSGIRSAMRPNTTNLSIDRCRLDEEDPNL